MKTFVGMFGIVAAFGFAIAIAYWFVAHEEAAGTALLALMGAALTFATAYAVFAERDARLEGDNPSETNEQAAGTVLESYTTKSAWPILIAICTLALLTGTLWSPLLAIAGMIGMLLCFWRLGAESARAGIRSE